MEQSKGLTEALPEVEQRHLGLEILINRLMLLFAVLGFGAVLIAIGALVWTAISPEEVKAMPKPNPRVVYFGGKPVPPEEIAKMVKMYDEAGM